MDKHSPPLIITVLTLQLICFAASAVLFVLGLFLPVPGGVKTFIWVACVILGCYDMIIDDVMKFLRHRRLDPNLLIIAAAAGTFAVGQGVQGAAAVLLLKAADLFQKLYAEKYGQAVGRILDRRPEVLSAVVSGAAPGNDAITRVPSGKLEAGDVFSVAPGEPIALDGVVISGESSVDEAINADQPQPRPVSRGSAVTGGSINLTGVLTIKASRTFLHSDASRILALISEPNRVKSRRQKLLGRLTVIFIPAVIAAAVIVGLLIPWIGGLPFVPWFTRGLTLLLLSAVAYISSSMSLTYFAGIGGAAGKGIIFKGAGYIDTLSRATSVVFEKTGILTAGRFQVIDINACGMPADKLMTMAAYAELNASHPIARTIVEAAGGIYDRFRVSNFTEYPGLGVEAEVSGAVISVGSALMMAQLGITPDISQTEHSVAYVAVNGNYAGRIVLSDTVRPEAKKAARSLRALGIDRLVIFTGDKKEATAEIAGILGITEYYAECLPEEKIKRLKSLTEMQLPGDKMVFVGDAVDEASVLHTADIGVVLGGFRSCAAEAKKEELVKEAGLIIMTEDVSKLAEAVSISRGTERIVRQNFVLALGIKALALILVLIGLLPIWAAVLTETAAAVLTMLNATRASGYKGSDMRNILMKNGEYTTDDDQVSESLK
jgi:Cd2+/Zn2+-exporting ATPase